MTALTAAARMEWIKLRSTWSATRIFLIFVVGMIGLVVWDWASRIDRPDPGRTRGPRPDAGELPGTIDWRACGRHPRRPGDHRRVLSALIRTALAAVPGRPKVFAAKVMVLAVVTLAVGEVLAFGSFFAGEAAISAFASFKPHASLGQPGVARAVLMGGAIPCLFALIGLGLGALVRHAAAAVSLVFGVHLCCPCWGSFSCIMPRSLPTRLSRSPRTPWSPSSRLPALSGRGRACW